MKLTSGSICFALGLCLVASILSLPAQMFGVLADRYPIGAPEPDFRVLYVRGWASCAGAVLTLVGLALLSFRQRAEVRWLSISMLIGACLLCFSLSRLEEYSAFQSFCDASLLDDRMVRQSVSFTEHVRSGGCFFLIVAGIVSFFARPSVRKLRPLTITRVVLLSMTGLCTVPSIVFTLRFIDRYFEVLTNDTLLYPEKIAPVLAGVIVNSWCMLIGLAAMAVLCLLNHLPIPPSKPVTQQAGLPTDRSDEVSPEPREALVETPETPEHCSVCKIDVIPDDEMRCPKCQWPL
ncbi:MAG: hypothetical protein AAFX06_16550 [Planctomycetota bacterium]